MVLHSRILGCDIGREKAYYYAVSVVAGQTLYRDYYKMHCSHNGHTLPQVETGSQAREGHD